MRPIKNIKASIILKPHSKPIFHHAREVPSSLQEEVNSEIDKMVKLGVITEIEKGGSEWASPIVIQRKGNGKICLCCDYKVTINEHIQDDAYHSPDMETVFTKLSGA